MQNYLSENIHVPRFEEANGFYTTKKRSRIMASIKGKNTKPEIRLRKALWHAGFRYRKNYKFLPGKPDIVSKKYKIAIFVDGEFWHGHRWETRKVTIKTNRAFWIPKIESNIQRDTKNNLALMSQGYKVFRFWEQEVRHELGQCVKQVLDYVYLMNDPTYKKTKPHNTALPSHASL